MIPSIRLPSIYGDAKLPMFWFKDTQGDWARYYRWKKWIRATPRKRRRKQT